MTLPRLSAQLSISDAMGRPSQLFMRWWDKVAKTLEDAEAANAATDATQSEALDILDEVLPKAEAAYERIGPGAYAFTASDTVPSDCRTAIVDTTAGAVTLTLLPVADCLDNIVFKKTNAGANSLTIEGAGSETIDGAANISFSTQYQSKTIRPALGAWHVVAVNP